MKKPLLAAFFMFGIAGSAFAQAPYRIHTSPKLPARDALERMNLVIAWNDRVKVEGDRDGIASVQLLPGKSNQLLVQTFRGRVYLYEADSGDFLWKNTVGVAFWETQPAGYNSQSIFVTRRNVLHVLNRFTGSQRVFTFNDRIKQSEFGYELNGSPNAGLVADEDFVYVPMGDRIHAIYIPDFGAIDRARKTMEARKDGKDGSVDEKKNLLNEDLVPTGPDSPQPVFFFGYKFATEMMTSPPLVYGEQVSLLTTDGTLTSINRFDKGPREELFEFQAHGKTLGGAGQYNNVAYVPSSDFNLYAVNMNGGKLVWRYVSGAPILRKPEVNDNDIFISPEKVGLRKVDRLNGKEIWTNRDSVRFLAANRTNVYAFDQVGKFFVLDARRGTTLAGYNLSDWAITMPNEWTDRVYLAANDGQILCLRHRDLTRPLVMKTEEAPKKEEKIEKKKQPEKKEEKKDDEKKDDKEKQAARRGNADLPADIAICVSARRHDDPWFAFDERLTWAGR